MKAEKDYYYVQPTSLVYTYYIDDEVTDSSDYRELFELLNNANEYDTVRLVISNYGGSLPTCIAIVNAVRACRALTIGVLTSIAYSAAGAIWLSCEGQEVQNHVGFMGHDAIGGTYGSLFQQKQRIDHEMEMLRSLYKDVYHLFLSEDEIETLLKNGDMWLTEKSIIQRLENRSELLEAERSQQQEDALNEMFPDYEELPDEVLLKLTKAQLIQYMKGEVIVDVSDTGKVTVLPNPDLIEDNI